MKFVKKPVVIDAKQFTGHNSTEIESWIIGLDGKNTCMGVRFGGKELWIETLEGGHIASAGDWIIRGI